MEIYSLYEVKINISTEKVINQSKVLCCKLYT